MRYDYTLLVAEILKRYKTMKDFATDMGIAQRTLYDKLNGISDWTQDEMRSALKLLNIPMSRIMDYFFRLDSFDNETAVGE